jgi:hypothetical protein
MMNDPIVEEVRQHRQAHAARYNHDLAAICKALQAKEKLSNRLVVTRPPRLVTPVVQAQNLRVVV